MKNILIIAFLLNLFNLIQAQNLDYLDKEEYVVKNNESYGEYDRNKFDIILPTENSQHGLVIFIHGGGFMQGDKSFLYRRKDDIKYFIQNNIAVATINYRFYNYNDSIGVKLCFQDIKRAIQYLRFNAAEYNIDKTRIGCYGGSAGAGSSLYFAFHDDMAIQGDSSLLGESTRIKCAAAISTQSTYNVFRWKKIIPFMRLIGPFKRKAFYNSAANFYGYPDYKSFKKNKKPITDSLDMLKMIDAQDPPVYLINLMKETFPKNYYIIQHHRKHAIVVSKKLDKFGIENHLYTSKNTDEEKNIDFTVREFMVRHLK